MINPEIIKLIESSGRGGQVSEKGAMGLMGVMPGTLKEWNEKHKNKKYTRSDMINNDKANEEVGIWYLNIRIPEMLAEYNIAPSPEAILSAYNWGAKNLKRHIYDNEPMPQETMDYLIKYRMGGDVRRGQEKLKALGFDPGPIDGDFGPRTRAAFQKFNETEQYGIGENW